MAVNSTSTVPINNSNANFRLWGAAFQGLFETGGFWQKKSSETGQIDWTTVVNPAVGTFAGFEMYQTNDTMSATFRLYCKVQFGNGAQTANSTPMLSFQFGTGTNGTGTLNGNTSGQFNCHPGASGSATSSTSYASGADGYFSMAYWMTGAGPGQFTTMLAVERSKDSSGNYTTDYITYVISYRPQNTDNFEMRTFLKPSVGTFGGAAITAGAHCMLKTGATAAEGTYVEPFIVMPYLGYADNPMTSLCGMKSGDISEGGYFDVIIYGITHHFLWTNPRSGATFGASHASMGWGIRYE